MSRVQLHGHGVYCYTCQEVYDGTEECDHGLGDKAGVRETFEGGYIAQPAEMGHNGPHMWMEIDGFDMCAQCNAVVIPEEMVGDPDA